MNDTMSTSDTIVEEIDIAAPPERGRVLLAPTDIPTVGRLATIMDPQGATLSLITYAKKN